MAPYEVELIEKVEEGRVFWLISGKDGMTLSKEDMEAAALVEKRKYEAETGRQLFRHHFDPMAGGLRPLRKVTEQKFRAGDLREENFAAPANGVFRPNADGVVSGPISQGKVGAIIGHRESNIGPGEGQMIAYGAYVAEF